MVVGNSVVHCCSPLVVLRLIISPELAQPAYSALLARSGAVVHWERRGGVSGATLWGWWCNTVGVGGATLWVLVVQHCGCWWCKTLKNLFLAVSDVKIGGW